MMKMEGKVKMNIKAVNKKPNQPQNTPKQTKKELAPIPFFSVISTTEAYTHLHSHISGIGKIYIKIA